MKDNIPWGVHHVSDMFPSEVYTRTNGHLVRKPAEPYASNLFERVRAAWWVLSGRAEAMIWPVPGDKEKWFPESR